MNYDSYSYLYPPRPESPIPRGLIKFYESRNWWGQVKKNGTNCVIFTCNDQVIFKTRHGAGPEGDHKAWSPKSEHIKFFKNSTNKWNVFVAELLHSKTPHIKDQLFIHDTLVNNGISLVGVTFEERQAVLQNMWTGNKEAHYNKINDQIVVAANFTENLTSFYDQLVSDGHVEDEGLVLKNPKAPLKACFKADSNKGTQVKVRVPHKNYSF